MGAKSLIEQLNESYGYSGKIVSPDTIKESSFKLEEYWHYLIEHLFKENDSNIQQLIEKIKSAIIKKHGDQLNTQQSVNTESKISLLTTEEIDQKLEQEKIDADEDNGSFVDKLDEDEPTTIADPLDELVKQALSEFTDQLQDMSISQMLNNTNTFKTNKIKI